MVKIMDIESIIIPFKDGTIIVESVISPLTPHPSPTLEYTFDHIHTIIKPFERHFILREDLF